MIERTKQWVLYGPSAPNGGDGTLGWLFGMWLWWRTWALLWLLLGGMVIAGVSQRYLGLGWFVPYVVGIVIGVWFVQVSPKYSVTKNY